MDRLLRRAEAELRRIRAEYGAVPAQLIERMGAAIAASPDPLDAAGAGFVASLANDLRGIAATLDQPLTADIADLLFRSANSVASGGTLGRPLAQLLLQGCRRAMAEPAAGAAVAAEIAGLREALRKP